MAEKKTMSVEEILARAQKTDGGTGSPEAHAHASATDATTTVAHVTEVSGREVAPVATTRVATSATSLANRVAAKPIGHKPTFSILSDKGTGTKHGPISKAEAAARLAAKPVAKHKLTVVPPMPAKPDYLKARPAAATQTREGRRSFFKVLFGSWLAVGSVRWP